MMWISSNTAASRLMAAILMLTLCAGALRAADAAEKVTLSQLPTLADKGDFDQVLAALKADADAPKDALSNELVKDLERYQANKAKRDEARRAAHDEAVKKMTTAAEAGKLNEAVLHAVEAHGLADDGNAFRESAPVVELVKRTEKAAQEAEDKGDWLEANALFRTLNLLYDDQSRYIDHIKRVEQRLRILRIYVPAHLEKMHLDRAKRLGDEKAEPLRLGDETWQDRLKDVSYPMMHTAIRQASRSHVSSPGYAKVIAGGLEGLELLLDMPSLHEAFAGLKGEAEVNRFREGLHTLAADVKEKGGEMGWLDASSILNRIESLNTDTIKLPEAVVTFEFTDGALSNLDDFTAVIWPRDKEQFSRNTQGKFYGVGIQIARRDNQLIVVSPLANTPAMKAGVKAGDIIAKVDGQPTSDWSLDRAVREITGAEGTDVTIGIQRPGVAEILSFTITRTEIPIESIRGWEHTPDGEWNYLIDKEAKIGYVRLSQFIPQSADDLDAAMEHMKKEAGGSINGLILDLRFNPGGLLSAAIELSDRFIRSGPLVSTVAGNGTVTGEARASADKTYDTIPVVVLINQGSASASEILSGALQDYSRALIVGQRSFGKGSVQDLYAMERGAAYLKLTTQYYRLPKGRIIHRKPKDTIWGIEPDLHVNVTAQQVADMIEVRTEADVLHQPDEVVAPKPDGEKPATVEDILAKSLDPQLEVAMLAMKTRLVASHLALVKAGESARKE